MAETNSGSANSSDIGRQQVGAVYAKALLGSAEAAGNAPELVEELESIVSEVLNRFPDFDAALSSPRISAEEKIGMLERVFGGRVSESVQTFMKVVSAHGRLDCLRSIASAARSQLNDASGVVVVEITTASPIDLSAQDQIRDSLSKSLGQEVRIQARVDSKIIGGLIVRIGDKLFDGSVANRLATMRDQAVSRLSQEIRENNERFALSP